MSAVGSQREGGRWDSPGRMRFELVSNSVCSFIHRMSKLVVRGRWAAMKEYFFAVSLQFYCCGSLLWPDCEQKLGAIPLLSVPPNCAF